MKAGDRFVGPAFDSRLLHQEVTMFKKLKRLGRFAAKSAVDVGVMAPVVVSIIVIGGTFLLITGGGNLIERLTEE